MSNKYYQTPLIMVRNVRGRGIGGRGVFATRDIKKGVMIEWAPCLLVPDDEIEGGTLLHNYAFQWIKKINNKKTCAIALGYISLYNHSYDSNAYYTMEEKDCITVWARRDIVKGDEIFINYNGNPTCQSKVGFRVNNGTNRNQLQKTKSKDKIRRGCKGADNEDSSRHVA